MTQPWLELTLTSHNDDEALLIETALEIAGAVSITYQAADNSEIFEPPIGQTPLWQATSVTGLFPRDCNQTQVIASLNESLGLDYPLEQHYLEDNDWVRAWLDYFKPISFGNNFWVAATEHVIEEPDAVILRLDPGMAFGTGTHPSTAMCISYIVNRAHLINKTVYDYGCGSGILGIAAALVGAKKVWQTDIDPQALQASKMNADKNGVEKQIINCADPNQAPQVDFLVANILLEPLCALRSQFEKHIHADSELLFAGILDHQLERITAAYQDAYDLTIVDNKAGWLLVHLRQRQ